MRLAKDTYVRITAVILFSLSLPIAGHAIELSKSIVNQGFFENKPSTWQVIANERKRSIPLTQFNFEDLVGKAATTLGAPLTLKKEACLPPQRGACNWQSSLGVRLQILQLDSRVIQVNVMLNGDNPDFIAVQSHNVLRTACAAVIAATASDWDLKSVRELASKLTAGSTRERHWRVKLERDGLLLEGEQSIPDRGGGFFFECTIMSQ